MAIDILNRNNYSYQDYDIKEMLIDIFYYICSIFIFSWNICGFFIFITYIYSNCHDCPKILYNYLFSTLIIKIVCSLFWLSFNKDKI